MKVLLINPPWVVRSRKNVWRSVASIMPSLGLAWLAAVLERDGHHVKILDAHAEHLGLEGVVPWAREHGPFELLGITATTPLIGNALALAKLLKAEFPKARIVLGGVHPTVLPAEALAEAEVELVVRGEGEETLREIAAEKPLDQIAGISYRREGAVVHNPERKLIDDLDALPFPAYHLLPMKKYRPAAGVAKRLPATSMLATRGCFGRCTFCYRLFGHRLRCRSGQNVAVEARLLHDRYGIRELCFYDDTFTAVHREVRAFCLALQEMKLNLSWNCFGRIDTFDEETFRLMKTCGCHAVMFGVETCNREILKNIGKNLDPERVEGVVRAAQKIGLEVRLTFMLGNPGETVESMEENIKFAMRLEPDLAQFNITTPYPGTEMFEWAEKNHCLRTKNWAEYDLSVPVLELPTVSAEKVLQYYRQSHRRFYLRPRFVWKRLRRVRSLADLGSLLRGARGVLGI